MMAATGFTEILVGFDARIVWAEQLPADATDVRTRLRIAEPMFVETLTWASLFEGYGMDAETGGWGYQTRIPPPKWRGPIHDSWDSLERLRAYLDEQGAAEKHSYHLITLSAFCEDEDAVDWYLTRWSLEITPAQRDPSWHLLGYDVADYSLYSGVASYLLNAEENDGWRLQLNAHGLFPDIERAVEFRDFASEIYEEPDPFEVFALYLIDTISAHSTQKL